MSDGVENENPHDDDPLDVEMSGSRGKPEGVSRVLESAAELMAQMPDGTRYDFELTIEEIDNE